MRFVQRFFLAVGFITLVYAGGTFAYAEFYQRYQAWKFDHKIEAFKLTTDASTLTESVVEPVELGEGDLIGKLEIPEVGISVMVLHGIEEETLNAGAGHVPGTPLPGGDGNSAIAGHRDTFFRKLEGIRAGDRIRFSTVHGTSEFVVDSTEIVEPADTQVMESRGQPELTLITCYPFYFVGPAPHRFIVHARPA
jgi:sortase A